MGGWSVKKFIIVVIVVLMTLLGLDTAYYRLGFYIDFHPN